MGHDRLVVFDHDHRFPGVDDPVQQRQKLLHIRGVQARRGFIQHLDGVAGIEFRCQFQALAFATGQGSQGLPESEITQPDVHQTIQYPVRRGNPCLPVPKEIDRVGNRHGHHLGDVVAAEAVLQYLTPETTSPALVAGGRHSRHHCQIRVDHPGSATDLTGSLRIGGEQGRFHPVRPRKGLANRVQQTRVGRRATAA